MYFIFQYIFWTMYSYGSILHKRIGSQIFVISRYIRPLCTPPWGRPQEFAETCKRHTVYIRYSYTFVCICCWFCCRIWLKKILYHIWDPVWQWQWSFLTFWRRNIFFFLILAHSVYKMWIKQEPNTLELWNKLHFEEKKRRVYTVFKIFSTCICWINI